MQIDGLKIGINYRAASEIHFIVIPAHAYIDVGGRATQEANAEAGIQKSMRWIPAFVGMTNFQRYSKVNVRLNSKSSIT